MADWLFNPLSLQGLRLLAMARAYLRKRGKRRQAMARHRRAFYEDAWRRGAAAIGASFTPLGDGFAEIWLGERTTRISGDYCGIDDPVTLELAGNKPLVYRLLQQEGLPVPRHTTFTLSDFSKVLHWLREINTPCVVKPASGTGGGRGVTTGVKTRGALAQAAAAAAAYRTDLLIEEQVAGENYRLLYLDGVLIDAFVRRPPAVVGDGHSTVAQLIGRLNNSRIEKGFGRSQVLVNIDHDVHHTLARQGLTLRSVVESGRQIVLKTVINENDGEDNVSVTRELCPEVIEAGATAARVVGARLAGVDLITPDPSRPLAEVGGIVLEVNTTPGFYYHYHKRDGEFPVAEHVLRRLLEPAARGDDIDAAWAIEQLSESSSAIGTTLAN